MKCSLEALFVPPPRQSVSLVYLSLNFSFLATSCQNSFKWTVNTNCTFSEKQMATEAAADALGEEWKGCVVPVTNKDWE